MVSICNSSKGARGRCRPHTFHFHAEPPDARESGYHSYEIARVATRASGAVHNSAGFRPALALQGVRPRRRMEAVRMTSLDGEAWHRLDLQLAATRTPTRKASMQHRFATRLAWTIILTLAAACSQYGTTGGGGSSGIGSTTGYAPFGRINQHIDPEFGRIPRGTDPEFTRIPPALR
jgi:hypothetical protein